MEFVVLSTRRPGVSLEDSLKRLAQRPEGHTHHIKSEYALFTGSPEVVAVIEADGPDFLTEWTMFWDDLYDVAFYPAVSTAGLT